MKIRDIVALPVESLAEENAHLYLWVTNNYLPQGFKVMWAWGFVYKTIVTWGKDKVGLGQYFRGKSEHCLFGTKGRLPYKTKNGKRQQGVTFFYSPRLAHSEKPEIMRRMIEKVSYSPYLELFARRTAPGWDAWGDEIGGKSIKLSFSSLLPGIS